ncbi:hypothetical protein IEQ_00704 [Bacillus cereus BAG6X1-2]|nr:hypothetical protein IEQ_00704 [Bacillus cereus BAG6X1-2]
MKKKLGVLSAACILSTSLFVGAASAAEVGNPKNLPAEGTVIPQKIDSTVDSYASIYPVYRYKTRHKSISKNDFHVLNKISICQRRE